ncbi:hypothetical protein [Gracilimonas sp.]|uniref:hypothetical protein n=1 Tax=Gracilimonas sp. TaxID=1974203 RepID=UPI003D0B56B9
MNKIVYIILLLVFSSCDFLQSEEEKRNFDNSEIEFLDFELTNFELEEPWEDLFLGFINVIKVDSIWHLWYETFNSDSKLYDNPSFNTFMNYAYSKDGINWIKPKLNIQEYFELDNNIIHFNNFEENKGLHGFSVFYDIEARYDERFKIVYLKYDVEKSISYLYGAVSSDGLNWKAERPLMNIHSDTQTTLFYHNGKYRLYYRYLNNINGNRYRQIGYGSSESFDNNFKKNTISFSLENETSTMHFYNNAARPLNDKTVIMFPSVFDVSKNNMLLYTSKSSINDYAIFNELKPINLPSDTFKIKYAAPQSIEVTGEENTYWLYLSLNTNGHDNWRNIQERYQGYIGRIKFKVNEN